MMLARIEPRGFRKHSNLTFIPATGLTAICGPNWSGKSSFLQAICYGLFGLRSISGTADDLPADGEGDARVDVAFAVAGRQFTVTRSPKTARLVEDFEDGSLETVAAGQSPVTAEIEQLLGISAKDFSDFHVVNQDEAQSLLTLGEPKLNDYVTRLTGLALVDKVLERTHELHLEAKGALGELSDLTNEIAGLQSELAATTERRARMAGEYELKKAWLDSLTESYQEKTTELQELEKRHTAFEKYRNESITARSVLKIEEEGLAEARAALASAPVVNQDSLSKSKNKLQSARSKVGELRERLNRRADLQKQVREAADNKQAVQDILDKLERPERWFTEQQIVDAQLDFHRAQDAASQAARAAEGAMCECCMRPFDSEEDFEAMKHRAEEAQAAAQLAAQLAAEVSQFIEVRKEILIAEDAMVGWERHLEYLNNQLSETDWPSEFGIKDLLDKISGLEKEVSELENRSAIRDKAQADVNAKEARVAKARATLESLGEPLKEVPQALMREVSQAVNELAEDYHRVYQAATALETSLAALAAAETKLGVDLAQAQDRNERFHSVSRRAKQLQDLGKFLRNNRSTFLASVWGSLLGYASTFIQQATKGDVTALQRGADGKFSFVEKGSVRSVAGSASGMQKAIFSIALKMSLAAALGSKFKVFLFDEVTAAAEDEVSLLITSLLANMGEQILMVTHRQADAAAADKVLQL
jgi:DNA repair exonuclease SbcCD ATPase subunit